MKEEITSVTENSLKSAADSEADDYEIINEVTKVMMSLGIPAHIRGYEYIRTALMLCIEDSTLIHSVTKAVYPTVARRYHSTSSKVERAIRHAVETAWERGNEQELKKYFASSDSLPKLRPSNSEFLAALSDNLRLKFKLL